MPPALQEVSAAVLSDIVWYRQAAYGNADDAGEPARARRHRPLHTMLTPGRAPCGQEGVTGAARTDHGRTRGCLLSIGSVHIIGKSRRRCP